MIIKDDIRFLLCLKIFYHSLPESSRRRSLTLFQLLHTFRVNGGQH